MKFKKVSRYELDKTNIKSKNLEAVGIDPNKVHFLQFFSLRAFAAYIHSIKDVKTFRYSSHKKDSAWSGTDTFEEALDLILNPYGEPPYKIQERVESIEKKIRNNLHKKGLITDWVVEDYHYDVEGIEIDIGKLIEGDPECYLKSNKKYKDHFYDLHINIAVSAGMSIDTIIDSFCKVIAVVVALEKRGHKIRLWVSSITKNITNDGDGSFINVLVKNYDEFVNIKSVARIIYPSFLRRIVFKVEEVQFQERLVSGYGKPVNQLKGVITIDSSLQEEELLNKIIEEYVCGASDEK